MKIIYSPECAGYEMPGHPESPRRVLASAELLKQKPRHQFVAAQPCVEADVLRAHSKRLLETVRSGDFQEPDTPSLPGIFGHALRSAGAAIHAAELAWKGEPVFSLMRPPGHHATKEQMMGFCYFNCIAIAVARLLEAKDGPKRVAIMDFDCHHGNGTQDIFYKHERVLYVSLHQYPCYPGTGLESAFNAHNYPVAPHTEEKFYLEVFDKALGEARKFGPDLIAVSAGFDAYRRDPITQMGLEIGTFAKLGQRLAALKRPMFAVLEGGYSSKLPKCIDAFLDGWELGVVPKETEE